jgi:TolB protein
MSWQARRAVSLVGALLVVACIGISRADADVSASGGKIAFERSDAIYLVNADGSGLQRLTPRGWRAEAPTWSPDGTKIVFLRRHPDARDAPHVRDELYVMRADGSQIVRLTRNRIPDDSPTWSPNKRVVAFVGHLSAGAEIFAVRADGSRLSQLTNNDGFDESPSWAPHGGQIAFVYSDFPDRPDIWVMDASGENRRQLTQADTAADGGPVWSPDGRKLAFTRSPSFADPGPPRDVIYVMNADGSDQRPLTQIDANFPEWSPNGRWVAFLSYQRNGNYAMYRMNAAGSGLRRLAANAGEFSWSPDGKRIVFDRPEDNNIYVMNADGSGKKRLTRLRGGYDPAFDPVWQPAS